MLGVAGLILAKNPATAICGWRGSMKVKTMLGLLLVLGTAFGATALSGSDPDPICIPGKPCQTGK